MLAGIREIDFFYTAGKSHADMPETWFRIIDFPGGGNFLPERLFHDKLRRDVCHNSLRLGEMDGWYSGGFLVLGFMLQRLFHERHPAHGASSGFIASHGGMHR